MNDTTAPTTAPTTATPAPAERDLVITRDIAASPGALFRCWTDPALIPRWFCPPPWTVSHAQTDPRPGGASLVVMRGPEGQEVPNPGVYLEVVPDRRIVTTDAYVRAWEPSAKPFMTLILSFDDIGDGRTRYTAIARHWSAEDGETHLNMGFHEGWGVATDQLAALAATLRKGGPEVLAPAARKPHARPAICREGACLLPAGLIACRPAMIGACTSASSPAAATVQA